MTTIPVDLTPSQLAAARRGAKRLALTRTQAESVRGRLNAASRPARDLACACGECRTCRNRERMRLRRSQ